MSAVPLNSSTSTVAVFQPTPGDSWDFFKKSLLFFSTSANADALGVATGAGAVPVSGWGHSRGMACCREVRGQGMGDRTVPGGDTDSGADLRHILTSAQT